MCPTRELVKKMNRFDISLGKKPPKDIPKKEDATTIRVKTKKDNYFQFVNNIVTLVDSDGNKIEGYLQQIGVHTDNPTTRIKSIDGSFLESIPGQHTTRIDLSMIVNRTIPNED